MRWRTKGAVTHSLSARLLLLTVGFVMLAEVLIFAPSVANFRLSWLNEKLGAGHLAILALDATPDGMVSEKLQDQLLDHAGAESIAVRRVGAKLALINDMPPMVEASFDLRDAGPVTLIMDAFAALFQTETRTIRVVGQSPKDPTTEIELVLEEWPLCEAMIAFAWRIFLLSLMISLITATLVFVSLQVFLVRPMRQLTRNMVRFAEDPEDERRIVVPGSRRDEVGRAQQVLADLQRSLHDALIQKQHLAALGTAVAKINHDLKSILSSALLVSDRLESSEDPEVRRVTPTLVTAIERAVNLCSQTMNYVGKDQPPMRRTAFDLHSFLTELQAVLPVGVALHVDVPKDIAVRGDRDQLYRVFNNLLGNAAQAGAGHIHVTCPDRDGFKIIDVRDDGPGLPDRAKQNLFKPFEGSVRAGGTGLGLAIARELLRGHGGDLTLLQSGAAGTVFRVQLPDEPA